MPPTLPSLDPLPLPAPVSLLYSLLLVLFLGHIVPMSIVLGGGFWAVVAGFRTRDPAFRDLSTRLSRQLPTWTAAAVTMGVSAFLFLEVLYGHTFYPASIQVAWPWLAAVGLAALGYGGYYLRASLVESHPRASALVGAAAWLAFAGVALAFVSQMTLMLHPERHLALYQADPRGARLLHGEPTFWPRYLHMLLGAIAVGALWIAWLGASSLRRGEEGGRRVVAFGATAFAWSTGVEALLGFAWMATLPRAALGAFLGASTVATGALAASVLLTFGAIASAVRAVRSAASTPALAVAGGQVAALLCLMVLMRDVVRRETLGAAARLGDQQVQSQTGAAVLFLALLAAAIGVVVWMARAARRPAPASASLE